MKKRIILLFVLAILTIRPAVKQEPKAFAVEPAQEPILKANVYQEEVYTTNNTVIPIAISSITKLDKEENVAVETETTGKEIKNLSLIECLIEHESGGNEFAKGDWETSTQSYRANGILQFHKPTFLAFCVDKYKIAYPADYLNSEYQIKCADLMLKDGLGFHWTTYKKCI